MKKINTEKMEALSGGIYCRPTDVDHYLHCTPCSPGYVIDAILNGSIINDPVNILVPGSCNED